MNMFSRSTLLVCFVVLSVLCATTTEALSPRLYGVNYSLKKGPDWDPNRCKNRDQVAADLRQLKDEVTDRVRLFSMGDCDTAAIVLSLASELNLGVWLGLWVGPDQAMFNDERQRLLDLMGDTTGTYDFSNVIGIHVSSEAIYREEITADEAIELHSVIRADVDAAGLDTLPVTVCDIIDTNLVHPELTRLDPRVTMFNQFPFWERTINITNAASYMDYRIAMIEAQNTDFDRQIVIGESGWADQGVNKDANVANPESMAKWMQDFVCLANSRGWLYFWFDAYDSDWRRIQENLPDDVEGHFGIFHANGTMKSVLRDLVIDCDGDSPPANDFVLIEDEEEAEESEESTTTSAPTTPPVAVPTPLPTTESTTVAPIASTPEPTESPTSPPVAAVVAVPTGSPVAPSTNAPAMPVSAAPNTAAPQTTSPVNAETIAPNVTTTAAPQAPTTSAPVATTSTAAPFSAVATTTNGTAAAVGTAANGTTAESSSSGNQQCEENSACAARGLTGQCCPTMDDWTLACCGDGPVEELCQGNERCAALELTGACCPTIDDKYLDCCEVVPDVCLINGTDSEECQRYSALQYKLDLATRSASTTLPLSLASLTVAAGSLMTWVLLLF